MSVHPGAAKEEEMPRAQMLQCSVEVQHSSASYTCHFGMVFLVLEICHHNDHMAAGTTHPDGILPHRSQHKQMLLSLLPSRTAAQPETQTDSCILLFSM